MATLEETRLNAAAKLCFFLNPEIPADVRAPMTQRALQTVDALAQYALELHDTECQSASIHHPKRP